jgi:hypothetical protein
MKFKGEPNLLVKFSKKPLQIATSKKGFCFDENGEYSTENEVECKALSQVFEVVPEEMPDGMPTEEPISESKLRHCKKCEFSCKNQGEMLMHYRIEHKEES